MAKTETRIETTTNDIREEMKKLDDAFDAWVVISDAIPEGDDVIDEALDQINHKIYLMIRDAEKRERDALYRAKWGG